jgi:KaiC/GvpD/RAD55 family RecA-like ATPase
MLSLLKKNEKTIFIIRFSIAGNFAGDRNIIVALEQSRMAKRRRGRLHENRLSAISGFSERISI